MITINYDNYKLFRGTSRIRHTRVSRLTYYECRSELEKVAYFTSESVLELFQVAEIII